jgi:hypothetical protein
MLSAEKSTVQKWSLKRDTAMPVKHESFSQSAKLESWSSVCTGIGVGRCVGGEGATVGYWVGNGVGCRVGGAVLPTCVGTKVGDVLGTFVGTAVGAGVGAEVGASMYASKTGSEAATWSSAGAAAPTLANLVTRVLRKGEGWLTTAWTAASAVSFSYPVRPVMV